MEIQISVPLPQGFDVSNFLNDVPRVPKSISEQGTISNHFPKIPKGINGPWVIRQRFQQLKYVPNIFKDEPNFLKDVPKVPKFVPMWGMTFNHYLRVLKRIIWTMGRQIGVSIARGLDVPKFLNDAPNLLKDVPRVPKFVLEQGTTSNYFLKIPKEIKRTTGNNIGQTQVSFS